MADDLMDFSEFDGDENDENADPELQTAPTLMQTPVVKHSILKQSTKDNLIQLFTPVNKNRKLKVHFTPSIQTPSVNGNLLQESVFSVEDSCSKDTQVATLASEEAEERAIWEERTTVLTKQDHEDYCQYAKEFLLDIISNLPIKEEESSGDSGIDVSMMAVQESTEDATHYNTQQPPAVEQVETDSCVDVLSEAADLLALLRGQTGTSIGLPDTSQPPEPATNNEECEEEPMDVDISMVPQPQEEILTTDQENITTMEQDNIPTTDQENIPTTEQDNIPTKDLKNIPATDNENIPTREQENLLKMEQENILTVDHQNIPLRNEETIATTENNKEAMPGKDSFVLSESQPTEEAGGTNMVVSEESAIRQDVNKSQVNDIEKKFPEIDTNQGMKIEGGIDINAENNTNIIVKTQVVEVFDEGSEVQNKIETVEDTPISIIVTDAEKVPSSQENVKSECEEVEDKKVQDDKIIVEKVKDNLEVNDQSSDEEFLSADEDMVVQEGKKPEQVESPPRTPPKVGYNLDFDDLDAMNPFQTKSCVQNSPGVSGNDEEKVNKKVDKKKENKKIEIPKANQEKTEVPKEVKKPSLEETEAILSVSSTESNLTNEDTNIAKDMKAESNDQEILLSGQTSEEMVQAQSPPLPKRGTYNLDDLDSMDPFKTKTQIMNSPSGPQKEVKQETDSFNSSKQIANSPVPKTTKKEGELIAQQNESKEEKSDPSKPKVAKIKKAKPDEKGKESANNLPENLDEVDPFKPGNQIVNSPPIKSGNYEPLPEDLDALDPFKPKKQMMNSPIVTKSDERKEESKSKTNSKKTMEQVELPENMDEIDPFKPKTQILNSPDKQSQNSAFPSETLADIDPFKSSNKMANTPSRETADKKDSHVLDSSKNAEVENCFPDSLEDADPFKPISQIAKSPAKGADLPENFDDIDPFKPRNQMMNSPKGGKDKDLPLDLDSIDPFKPKTQVPNSPDLITDLPDRLDEVDPFKPRNQMKNSPVSQEKNDLSKKTNETNKKTSDVFDDIDPFKPQTQIQNSPKQSSEDNLDTVDPFKSQNKLQNSPKKGPDDNFNAIDPFKPRQQMVNSPVGRRLKSSEGTPKTVLSPFLNRQNRLPATPEETFGADGEVMEVQGVTRRGDAGATNAQGFDFDESEFVAASEVFKDPGVWEMLEQFGNTASNTSQDSALSRMSLYVKFDPLVEGTSRLSTNARRISIRPKQLEKVKEYGLEDTFLLLGTPPKKKRQSMNVSQLRHTPVSSTGGQTQSHKPRELNMEQGAVDLIMALSPEGDGQSISSQSSQPTSLLPSLDDEEGGSGLFEELKYTNSDLRRFRNDLKLEFQGQLIAEKKEWSKKEQHYEETLREARAALDEKKKEVQELLKACVMFEETVEKMKAKQEKEHNENQQLREDIQGVENAFSDLHRRYEKLKMVVEGNLKNEEILKKYASDLMEKLKTSEENYSTLKKTAEEKMAKSAQEIEKLKHQVSSETNKNDAAKKVMAMKIESLEKQLQQKIEENKNLTEICDQLIQKAEN